jgi:4-alpha-glucanotransferase
VFVNEEEDLPEDYADWQPRKDSKDRRRAGILLHPTSLPGSNDIGPRGR